MDIVPTGFLQLDRFLEDLCTAGASHLARTSAVDGEEEMFTHRAVLRVDLNTSDATTQHPLDFSQATINATGEPHLQTVTEMSERDRYTSLRLTTPFSSLYQSLLERYFNGDENDGDDVDEEAPSIDWESGTISTIDADDLLRSSAEDTELSDSVDTLPLYERSLAASTAETTPSDSLPPPYQPLPAVAQTPRASGSR